eukprot:gene4048-5790_t
MNGICSGNEDDHINKKLKIEAVGAEDLFNPNGPLTVESNGDKTDEEDPTCILCFESAVIDDKLIIQHQCEQCAKNSWKICFTCNENLLSRTCPVCRSDYAPIILHLVPDHNTLFLFSSSQPLLSNISNSNNLTIENFCHSKPYKRFTNIHNYAIAGEPLMKLGNTSMEEDDRVMMIYKFGIIRHLIGKSNVAVWSPSKSRMFFSLPQEFVDDPCTTPDVSCHTISMPMTADRVKDKVFLFTNKVWDEIEHELENGPIPNNGEIMPCKQAIQWILSHTRDESDQIFTMMQPQDWEKVLNPEDCEDALNAIRATIVSPTITGTAVP